MQGRSYTSISGYRFGFNGKEQDGEVSGSGNQYDYGFRIYNPRLGKFLSVDPLTQSYPFYTPYQFAGNSPISGIDLDGLEYYYAATGELIGTIGTSTEVRIVTGDDNIELIGFAIGFANKKQEEISASGVGTVEDYNYLNGMKTEADKLSKPVDMNNEELNTRAFMTLIRRSEADGNAPLDYNIQFGGGTFTEESYEDAPKDYADHPKEIINKRSSAAGAYQIMQKTWENVIVPLDNPSDFGPQAQDAAVIRILSEQQRWNNNKSGLFEAIHTGDISTAISMLGNTWTSLPGGKEELISLKQATSIFNEAIKAELNGSSVIDTPKGELDVEYKY
jgi:RHS repeat-associated protein